MASQLLLIEIFLKAVAGSLLLLFPRTLARLLGLAPATETFWPRLLGVTLIGLAGATLIQIRSAPGAGLGLGGHVALNLVTALALIALLILGRGAPAWRGRLILGLSALLLTGLGLFELAWV